VLGRHVRGFLWWWGFLPAWRYRGLLPANRGARLRRRNWSGPRCGWLAFGSGRARRFGRSRLGEPPGGPYCGTDVRGFATYRLLRPRHRRPRLRHGYALRALAGQPVGGRGTGGIRNPRLLLCQGRPTGAQQQAHRHHEADRRQGPAVSRGNTHRATSAPGGMKKPVVILHNPQRRHTLQGPADPPACSRWFSRPTLPAITGPPESFVNSPRDRHQILASGTSTSSRVPVRPGIRPGPRAPKRCHLVVRLFSRLPLFSGVPTRHADIVA
jgi:hypothetical protein